MSSNRIKPVATKVKSEFPLAVTKKAKILALLPVCLAVYMLFLGASTFHSFHPLDPSRYLLSLPPVAISLLTLGTLFAIPKKMCTGVIYVRDSGVEYNPGDHDLNVNFPWNDLIFSAPPNRQQMMRKLILAHRDKKLVIYDLFLPDFDLLLVAIGRRKNLTRATQGDAGLKIDSGKIGDIDPRMTGR